MASGAPRYTVIGPMVAFLAVLGAALVRPFANAPAFLNGESPLEYTVGKAGRVVSVDQLVGDGKFSEIEYLYGLSFSPDGQWLSFLVDAKPSAGGPTHYYVYIARPDGSDRTLVLDTQFGPELERSLAWTPAGVVLASPDFPEEVTWPETTQPPTTHQIQVRGTDPSLSPDGKTLAFRRPHREGASLWKMPFGPGNKPEQWSAQVSEFAPLAWSLDSRNLAFLSPLEQEAGEGLWLAQVEGAPRPLCREPLTSFSWSPTGDFLAAVTVANELKLITLDGASEAIATDVRDFEWSPTGDALCYVGYLEDGATEAVFWRSARGGQPRQLLVSQAPGEWDFSHVRFSPDGSLVYVRAAAGRDVTGDGQYMPRADRSLYVVSCDGGRPPKALPLNGTVLKPALSPDQHYLAVGAEREDGSFLWCVDLQTSKTAMLGRVPVEKYAYSLAWSPDGRSLVLEDQGNIVAVTLAKPG